jgi:hypothetical protein
MGLDLEDGAELVVRPEGLEPPAYWFEASRSIQLSYGRAPQQFYREQTTSRYRPSGLGISSRMRRPPCSVISARRASAVNL